jgi:hypothetical protein
MERDIRSERDISKTFWVEVVHMVVHMLNKVHLRLNIDKTPYELCFGRPTSIKHFKVFGSKFYIKNNDDHLGKFDSRYDEGVFLGYETKSKGYICFNKRMHKLVDCVDVRIDEEAPIKDQQRISTKPDEKYGENNEDKEQQIS